MHSRNRTEKGVQNPSSLQDGGWHPHTSNKPSPKKFSEIITEKERFRTFFADVAGSFSQVLRAAKFLPNRSNREQRELLLLVTRDEGLA